MQDACHNLIMYLENVEAQHKLSGYNMLTGVQKVMGFDSHPELRLFSVWSHMLKIHIISLFEVIIF